MVIHELTSHPTFNNKDLEPYINPKDMFFVTIVCKMKFENKRMKLKINEFINIL